MITLSEILIVITIYNIIRGIIITDSLEKDKLHYSFRHWKLINIFILIHSIVALISQIQGTEMFMTGLPDWWGFFLFIYSVIMLMRIKYLRKKHKDYSQRAEIQAISDRLHGRSRKR